MIIALLAATALAGCGGSDSRNAGQGNAAAAPVFEPPVFEPPVTGRLDRSRAGTAAPALAFEDGAGRSTSMAAFRGRPVLVNLWATWCAPCIVEMPSLDALAAREGEALEVLALSQDLGGRALVTGFFAQRDFQALEANLDPQMGFMTALGLSTLPTTILYDADGREVWRMTGMADWTSERTARLLDEAEAG